MACLLVVRVLVTPVLCPDFGNIHKMWFIDRLDVHQVHHDCELPIFGREIVVRTDLETGEQKRCSPTMKSLEGSYSTTLQIRSDGQRVSVDGNPSRWGRLDNLFGLTTFDECIDIYNIILKSIGLPPFTLSSKVWWEQAPEDKRPRRHSNGAVFRRIDWTRNLSTGAGNEQPFLRGISTQTLGNGKLPFLYPNGNTVSWGQGSNYWSHKLYNKAAEMMLPRNKRKFSKLSDELSIEEIGYYNNIIKFCKEHGIVRDEKQFGRSFLTKKNLCDYGLITEEDFLPYLTDIDKTLSRFEATTMNYETIADQLIEQGICKSRHAANASQSYVYKWLHGEPMQKTSSFYVQRNRLLQLGIDLSVGYDASKPIPQIKHQRDINVTVATPPYWYKPPIVDEFSYMR